MHCCRNPTTTGDSNPHLPIRLSQLYRPDGLSTSLAQSLLCRTEFGIDYSAVNQAHSRCCLCLVRSVSQVCGSSKPFLRKNEFLLDSGVTTGYFLASYDDCSWPTRLPTTPVPSLRLPSTTGYDWIVREANYHRLLDAGVHYDHFTPLAYLELITFAFTTGSDQCSWPVSSWWSSCWLRCFYTGIAFLTLRYILHMHITKYAIMARLSNTYLRLTGPPIESSCIKLIPSLRSTDSYWR
jgi:hypothetical protein